MRAYSSTLPRGGVKQKDHFEQLKEYRRKRDEWRQQQVEFEERLQRFRQRQQALQDRIEALGDIKLSLACYKQEQERKQEERRWLGYGRW